MGPDPELNFRRRPDLHHCEAGVKAFQEHHSDHYHHRATTATTTTTTTTATPPPAAAMATTALNYYCHLLRNVAWRPGARAIYPTHGGCPAQRRAGLSSEFAEHA